MSFGREQSTTFKKNSISISTRTDFTNIDCDQYYQNLQTNIQYYKNALKTAQELIAKYKAENQTLNIQNRQLQMRLGRSEKKIQVLEIAIKNSKHCQKIIKQSSQQVEYFLNKQRDYVNKINVLNEKIQQLLMLKENWNCSQKKKIDPSFNLKRTSSSKQKLSREDQAILLRNRSKNIAPLCSKTPFDLDIHVSLQRNILSNKTTPSYSSSQKIIEKINSKVENDLAIQFEYWKTNKRVNNLQRNQFFRNQRSLSKNRGSKGGIWK